MTTTHRGYAYSYIRMSRPEQLRGDSLRRQLDASRQYAESRGFTINESLRDLGLSAYHGAHRERGALGAFLTLVERGEIPSGSLLVIESLDRLSREAVLDALAQFTGIINAGIEIVTLSDNQRYSRETISQDWAKLLVSLTIMSRAHEESVMKSKRLAAAWEQKRARAASEKKAMTARCPAWIRLNASGKYELIPERAAVVRRIFETTARGIGRTMLTKILNRENVPTFGSSRGWQPSYLQKILESEATYGKGQSHRKLNGRRVPEGAPLDGYFPAAIEEELFWQARSARESRRGGGGRKGEGFANLLAGLCKCGACGARMVHVNKGTGPKGGRYLQCDGARRGLGCKMRLWRYDQVERVVLDSVGRLDLARILAVDGVGSAAPSRVALLQHRLAAAKSKRTKLLDAFGDMDDDGEIKARIHTLTAEIRVTEKEIKIAETEEKTNTAVGALPSRLDLCRELAAKINTTQGNELFSLRAALAQELRRVLRELSFWDTQIMAHYAVPAKGRRSAFAFPDAHGVPLLGAPDAVLEPAEPRAPPVGWTIGRK